MGLISKSALLATGYVLGARAGTARYEQIVNAARQLANRAELQPYLARLNRSTPGAPTGLTPTNLDTNVETTTPATPPAPPDATAPTPQPTLVAAAVPPLVEPQTTPASPTEGSSRTPPPSTPKVTVTGRGRSSRGRRS